MFKFNHFKILYYKFLIKYILSPSSSELFHVDNMKKKCIVCLAADYGNLGDVAITYAQSQFLQSILPGYEIVDFPISKTLINLKALKKICNNNDIITIVGGGNMGDLYGDIELLRLMIVMLFPQNRIISFPQTIEYKNPSQNKFLLNLSQSVYNKHKHLLLCAREDVSYAKIKELYPHCQSCLLPDIVMTLDKRSDYITRNHNLITLCLRDDKEKMHTELNEELLKHQLECKGFELNIRDTHIGKSHMSIEERNEELRLILDDFSRSRVIITDRLHGMIFAFITGTPAVVLPNNNFKVEKCYEWIKDCGFIEFVNEPSNEGVLKLIDINEKYENFYVTHQCINTKMQQIVHYLEL